MNTAEDFWALLFFISMFLGGCFAFKSCEKQNLDHTYRMEVLKKNCPSAEVKK